MQITLLGVSLGDPAVRWTAIFAIAILMILSSVVMLITSSFTNAGFPSDRVLVHDGPARGKRLRARGR